MSSATSTPTRPPKAMSSRLLTMKFMQRAAASSPVSSPSTPDLPSIKRRKTGDASPGAFEVDALVDQRAVEVALANEEALRQAALDRAGAEAGDTRWILNFKQDEGTATEHSKPSYQIIQTGFAAIDNTKPDYVVRSINNEDQRPVIIGRRSFGKFNRAVEKSQNPDADESSDDTDDEEEERSLIVDEETQGDATSELLRGVEMEVIERAKAERKKKRKAEKAEAQRLAESRKKKEVNLNNLTSLSGASTPTKQACHKCGQVGHLKNDCPKRRKDHDGGEGRPRKSRKST